MVSIDVRTPHDLDPATLAELQAAEATRARELVDAGSLWRIPGRRSNICLYEAADATELHAAISSLPLFPYMDIQVQVLATHPVEAHLSR